MLRKDVKEIKAQINELSKDIVNKAAKYDQLVEQLKEVKINVAKTYTCWDDKRFAYVVKVEYQVPTVTLIVDESGDALLNERFKAMNVLGLSSLDDMDLIASQIAKAYKLNTEEVK